MSDYNFRAETTISEEVNNSNEELMEEDVVCWNCLNLDKENRRLKNRIVTLEEQVSKRKTESRRYRRQGKKGFTRANQLIKLTRAPPVDIYAFIYLKQVL